MAEGGALLKCLWPCLSVSFCADSSWLFSDVNLGRTRLCPPVLPNWAADGSKLFAARSQGRLVELGLTVKK